MATHLLDTLSSRRYRPLGASAALAAANAAEGDGAAAAAISGSSRRRRPSSSSQAAGSLLLLAAERRWERLIFHDILPVGVKDKAFLLDSESWYMDMPLVSGHCYVQAWYSAMSKAIKLWMEADASETPAAARGGALTRAACLLECGLTVTIHAKECLTDN